MADVTRLVHPIDQLIETINAADFTILANGGYKLRELMDEACPIFEQHHSADQAIALALMFGMMCATIEGESVEMERDNNILVSFEDRLRVFAATATIAFRDAMIARKSEPGQPQPM